MMDYKKVKLFSWGVLLSTLFLVVGVICVKYFGDYYLSKLVGDSIIDVSQRIMILRWVIVGVFSVTLFISYISLLIQTCRIDSSSESHFFIIMAMLSIIPLCAITLIVRTSHLQYLERNKKLEFLAESIENEQKYENSLLVDNENNMLNSSIDEITNNVQEYSSINNDLFNDESNVSETLYEDEIVEQPKKAKQKWQ